MKNKYGLAFLISVFFFNFFLPRVFGIEPSLRPDMQANNLVTLDFQDANLNDVLKVLSVQSGMNFIASNTLKDKKMTMFLDKVSVSQALDNIFQANGLTYDADQKANIYVVKDAVKPVVEMAARVFFLKYASVSNSALEEEKANYPSGTSFSDSAGTTASGSSNSASKKGITIAVEKLLSINGKVVEDFRTNSLVVSDLPNYMEKIAATIAALDVPTAQVMLEVEMLDVSKNAIDRMGIKFTDTMTASMFGAIVTGAKISSGLPIPENFYQEKNFAKTFTPGNLDFSQTNWKVYFDFIKQNADGKILARPRILTLNNETAEIKITTDEAIGTISLQQGQGTAASTTTSAERVETGVSLRVTPQIIQETGEITMFILPSVKDAAISTFNTTFKDPEERATRSVVRVKDGETVIIGGLIRKDRSETITKVPFLGDIPLLGKMFTHRYKDKDKERELLVFITPRLVKDNKKVELAKVKKSVNLPVREQTAALAVHNPRQQLINEYLDQLEQKKKK